MIISRLLISLKSRYNRFCGRLNSIRLSTFVKGVDCQSGVRIASDVKIHLTKGARLSLGADVSIGSGSFLYIDNCHCSIGNKGFIGRACTVVTRSDLQVGDDFLMAENATLMISGSNGTTKFGRNVWLGAGSSVQSVHRIEEGAILGANSRAVTDLPEYSISVGNPSKVKHYVRGIDD